MMFRIMQFFSGKARLRNGVLLAQIIFLAAVVSLLTPDTARAAGIVETDPANISNIVGSDQIPKSYKVTIRPLANMTNPATPTRLGFTANERTAVRAGPGLTVANFNNWTVANSAIGRLPGQITVTQYDAYINNPPATGTPPGQFVVLYDSANVPVPPNPAAGAFGGLFARLLAGPDQLVWIQLVTSNAPCKAGLNAPAYLDPQCMPGTNLPDDDLPFYWTQVAAGPAAEHGPTAADQYIVSGANTGTATATVRVRIRFTDAPGRPFGQGAVNWGGALALASWDGAMAVTAYDVIDWGFDFTCQAAVAGAGNDTFAGAGGDKVPSEQLGNNPFPICAPVGGVAELPEVAGTPLETDGSSGVGAGVLASVAGAVLAGGVALGGAAWYARRRLVRR